MFLKRQVVVLIDLNDRTKKIIEILYNSEKERKRILSLLANECADTGTVAK